MNILSAKHLSNFVFIAYLTVSAAISMASSRASDGTYLQASVLELSTVRSDCKVLTRLTNKLDQRHSSFEFNQTQIEILNEKLNDLEWYKSKDHLRKMHTEYTEALARLVVKVQDDLKIHVGFLHAHSPYLRLVQGMVGWWYLGIATAALAKDTYRNALSAQQDCLTKQEELTKALLKELAGLRPAEHQADK